MKAVKKIQFENKKGKKYFSMCLVDTFDNKILKVGLSAYDLWRLSKKQNIPITS